jgi:hypothetical protein
MQFTARCVAADRYADTQLFIGLQTGTFQIEKCWLFPVFSLFFLIFFASSACFEL